MNDQDMAQIKAMIEGLNAHHEQECLVNPSKCQVRWRRRLVVVVTVVLGMYVFGEVIHLEAFLKGWEFLGAAVVDKLIFGIE